MLTNAPLPTSEPTPRNPDPLCYNSLAMLDTFLVLSKTTVTAKGDGPSVSLGDASNRVFLLTLQISEVIEQESLDVSIFGSADGATWGPKSITSFPQKFYRGQHPILLDLTGDPAVKFVRAHWEVSRWGRGDLKPMFQIDVAMKEVPPGVLQEATAEAQALL